MKSDLEKYLALPIVSEACRELSAGLPPTLVYHTYEHTQEVIREAYLFAEHDGLSARDTELLVIGATFHDFGFLTKPEDNESIGAKEASTRARKAGGYSEHECALLTQMILDTRVITSSSGQRQEPTSTLGRYLCDADVSNFGREDFWTKVDLVRREVGTKTEKEFLKELLVFLSSHHWHTDAAHTLRSKQKELNLAQLRKRLGSLA